MTIRIYPSRLEGEPIGTHETEEKLTIVDWLKSVAPNFKLEAENKHPTIRLNGRIVLVEDWPHTYFKPSDVLDVYIEPRGLETATIIAISAFVVSLGVSLYAMANMPDSPRNRGTGKTLGSPDAFANVVKWGDPIPENFGEPRIYPPYLTPPRMYYDEPRSQWLEALLCIGQGKYDASLEKTYVSETPYSSLGADAEFTFFDPNETIPAEMRQWWYTPDEVGFTQLGGAGLTLLGPEAAEMHWADAFIFDVDRVTSDDPTQRPPGNWTTSVTLRIEAAHPIKFNGDTVVSEMLDTLELSVGEIIEFTGTNAGIYELTSIIPAVPASAGSEAKATGTAAPTTFDFSTTSAYLDVMFDSFGHIVTLDANYTDLSGLVAHIGTSLSGSGLSARSVGSFVEIYEDPPYTGNTIEIAGDVATVFGTVTYTAGTPPTPAEPAKYIFDGENFGVIDEVAAAGRQSLAFDIIVRTEFSIIVRPEGLTTWSGFPSSIVGNASFITPSASEGQWTNWFTAVPEGETSSYFECDIFYPKGLWRTGSRDRPWWMSSKGFIQWRYVGSLVANTVSYTNRNVSLDQVGYTIPVTIPTAGRFQVRMRRESAPREWNGEYDQQQWTGLRARLDGAPSSYPFSTMFARIRSGDKISGNSENKVNLFAKRILPRVDNPSIEEPTRDIVPAVLHMTDSVGYDRSLLDMPKLESLHEIWVSRGDTFDLSVSSSTTLKTVINYALGAGMAELTLKNGKISAVREQYQLGTPNRIYSPQEMTGFLSESTEAVMPDDIDGVDIDYVERETGREVTVQYRLQGDLGHRVEKITAPGVSGRTQAWRIAARRRRDAAFSRTVFNGGTELAAMNSYYGDFVGLQDGITGWGQSAFVLSVSGTTMILSEEVKPVDGTMVAMLRKPDGSATVPVPVSAYDGRSLTLSMIPDDITISSDPNSPTIVYIGSNTRIIHQAIMKSVEPSANGTVSFVAKKYDARVYLEDDMGPDHVILTSMPYPVYDVDNAQATLAITSIVRREVNKIVDLSDDANATLAIASIVRRDIYRVREYEDEAEATLAISSIVRRDLARTASFSDEAEATLAITSIVRKSLNITYDYNDEAEATLAITSIVRKNFNITYDYNDEANATLAISSIVRTMVETGITAPDDLSGVYTP